MNEKGFEQLFMKILSRLTEESSALQQDRDNFAKTKDKIEQLLEKMVDNKEKIKLTELLSEIENLKIENDEIKKVLKTCIAIGLENNLPDSQYKQITEIARPLLREKLFETIEQIKTIETKIEQYSKYADFEYIKNNLETFEKDISQFKDLKKHDIILALCLASCSDFNITVKENVDKDNKKEEKSELLQQEIDKYEDFKNKQEIYKEKIKRRISYQIKRFETIDIYQSDIIFPSEFYKTYNELKILYNNFNIDKQKIEELIKVIREKNIEIYYEEFLIKYNYLLTNIEILKKKTDECLELYNKFVKVETKDETKDDTVIKQDITVEEPKDEENLKTVSKETKKIPEQIESVENKKHPKQTILKDEANKLLNKAKGIYNKLTSESTDKLQNFVLPLELLIEAFENNPQEAEEHNLKQILYTIECLETDIDQKDENQSQESKIKNNEKNAEENDIPGEEKFSDTKENGTQKEYGELGDANIILFLKNNIDGEFCLEKDLEELSTSKNIQKRTEKEVLGLIEKLSNIPYVSLATQSSGKGKGNKFTKPLKPITINDWGEINPYRVVKGESRSVIIALSICDAVRERLPEIGYDPSTTILLVGGVIGEKKDKDLKSLELELKHNFTYISYLNQMLNNPNPNDEDIENLKSIIDESNKYYTDLSKNQVRSD